MQEYLPGGFHCTGNNKKIWAYTNSNEEVLNAVKVAQSYGFLVKPFRVRDLIIILEIARYRHEHTAESIARNENIVNDKLPAIIHNSESLSWLPDANQRVIINSFPYPTHKSNCLIF